MMRAPVGVIHGRFQVFHSDHLRYLLAGKSRCDLLVVGITNPDPTLTRFDPSAPERSLPGRNPLTYFERYLLVWAAMRAEGIGADELAVVPFPVNFPELYGYYVPLDAVFYLTIYDEWGRRKRALFEERGLRTEVLWERLPEEKGIASTEVRRRMVHGESWEQLMPPVCADLMRRWDVPRRLRADG